jgi:hypothetical protein
VPLPGFGSLVVPVPVLEAVQLPVVVSQQTAFLHASPRAHNALEAQVQPTVPMTQLPAVPGLVVVPPPSVPAVVGTEQLPVALSQQVPLVQELPDAQAPEESHAQPAEPITQAAGRPTASIELLAPPLVEPEGPVVPLEQANVVNSRPDT